MPEAGCAINTSWGLFLVLLKPRRVTGARSQSGNGFPISGSPLGCPQAFLLQKIVENSGDVFMGEGVPVVVGDAFGEAGR